MCGIAGVFGSADPAVVQAMLGVIPHRGRDESQVVSVGDDAAIGINRLSLMDAAHGSQPLANADGRVQFVCNGEIYNHRAIRDDLECEVRFATDSDAEVIGHLYDRYGADFIHQLDGMFAILLYDEARRDFVAARDRFGIKPLYVLRTGQTWHFASEAKALLTVGGAAADIREVPPGWMVTSKGLRPWVRQAPRQRAVPDPAIVRALLDASVAKHLQSDPGMPVGVFLSGGLDSSVIAALLVRHRPDAVAFAIGMEGSPDMNAARRVARHLGIRLVERSFTFEEALALLPDAVAATESFNTAIVLEGVMTMLLAEAAAAENVRIILSGEGSDEIFAGYGAFRRLDPRRLRDAQSTMMRNIHKTECRRLDRATMAYTVEGRVPFLDAALVDYALSLPATALIRDVGERPVEKWILRKAFEDMLPADIVWRVKIAFDHGSGILGLIDRVADGITDEDLDRARRENPRVALGSKLALYLYRIWRQRFGDMGGTDAYQLFGDYPVMQAMLNARTSQDGGTGEARADLGALRAQWAEA